MVQYECFRCGYNTKYKSSFIDHLNRKYICKPIEDDIEIKEIKKIYGFENHSKIAPNCSKIAPNCSKISPIEDVHIAPNCSKLLQNVPQIAPNCSILLQNNNCKAKCEYCLKTFSRNSNLTKHLKTCKKKKKAEMLAITQNEKIIKMEKEIEELKNYKIQTQNNITYTNSHNTINNTININNYGDENLKHLRSKDFANLLDGIYGAVPKLIKQIHFDPEHPENQNIKLSNKKLPYIKIKKNDKWQFVDRKTEIINLIDAMCFILSENYQNMNLKGRNNLNERQKNVIEKYLEKYRNDDKKLLSELENIVDLTLINNSL